MSFGKHFSVLTLAVWAMITCGFALFPAQELAAESTQAVEDPILHVTYNDGSGRSAVSMDLDSLKKLPAAGFETTTVWTEGVQAFEGVWLKDLVAHLGVETGTLELIAINDYLTEITVQETTDNQALLAYHRNGAPMSSRDKGPLWVVFPYDQGPEFRTETRFAQSIWQLDRIEITR